MKHSMMVPALCAAGLAVAPALAQQQTQAQGQQQVVTEVQNQNAAHAMLMDQGGQQVGTVTLVQGPNGVLVTVDVQGLPAGGHGFHVHQTGQCQPDFEAAGDHYNPDGMAHGFLHEGGHHAGDLPNLQAGDNGIARADYFTDRISLEQGAPNTVFDGDGSAFIIHERMDSYGEEANAGGRLACGVIQPGQM